MEAEERERIWRALRELHSAVTDLKIHAEQNAPVDLGTRATGPGFGSIDVALKLAGEAIAGLRDAKS